MLLFAWVMAQASCGRIIMNATPRIANAKQHVDTDFSRAPATRRLEARAQRLIACQTRPTVVAPPMGRRMHCRKYVVSQRNEIFMEVPSEDQGEQAQDAKDRVIVKDQHDGTNEEDQTTECHGRLRCCTRGPRPTAVRSSQACCTTRTSGSGSSRSLRRRGGARH